MSDPDQIERHYDALADSWEAFVRGAAKEEILWPAVSSLLPDVEDSRVLDAGCGNGYYAALLAEQGADVLGIDASEEMIRVAREQYDEAVEFRRGDLESPLDDIADESFDLVVCQHVFSHLADLETTVAEFARILRPGGSVVVSTHHPFHDFLVVRDREYPNMSEVLDMNLDPVVVPDAEEPDYQATERFTVHWSGPDSSNPGTYYRRSLGDLLGPLFEAGFELGALLEPTIPETFEREYPNAARELQRRPPRSICLRAER